MKGVGSKITERAKAMNFTLMRTFMREISIEASLKARVFTDGSIMRHMRENGIKG